MNITLSLIDINVKHLIMLERIRKSKLELVSKWFGFHISCWEPRLFSQYTG